MVAEKAMIGRFRCSTSVQHKPIPRCSWQHTAGNI